MEKQMQKNAVKYC